MALDKSKLEVGIKGILEDMITRESNSFEEFASRLATEIDSYVKDADIIYTGGLAASTYPVVGTFEGSLK